MQHSFIGVPQEKHRANNWDFPVAGETKEGAWGAGAHTAEFVIFLVKFPPRRKEVCYSEIVSSCAAAPV